MEAHQGERLVTKQVEETEGYLTITISREEVKKLSNELYDLGFKKTKVGFQLEHPMILDVWRLLDVPAWRFD